MSATRILHVEVGGSYGGSLRALEVYLTHSERRDLEHDALLYLPTPCAERLASMVRRLSILYPGYGRYSGLTSLGRQGRLRGVLRPFASLNALAEARDWVELAGNFRTALKLRRLLVKGAYDVVHMNNTFTYQIPTLLAARMAGLPVVAHGRNPIREGPLARRMMRLTAHVVTDSDALRKTLEGWGVPVPVKTCYNCVELPPPDAAASAALRDRLLPSGGILIGSVGRLDLQKGYEFLVRAAARVLETHPEVRFAVAGEGPERPALQALILAHRLEGRFHLSGFHSDVTNFIGALDLFVSSSRWEGLPLALVEALLLGKPVVATNVGGNTELIRPGATGLLVPPADPVALAAAMIAILEGTEVCHDSVETARDHAARIADPKANARTFDDVVRVVQLTRARLPQEWREQAPSRTEEQF